MCKMGKPVAVLFNFGRPSPGAIDSGKGMAVRPGHLDPLSGLANVVAKWRPGRVILRAFLSRAAQAPLTAPQIQYL
jgi:hypothetical protein